MQKKYTSWVVLATIAVAIGPIAANFFGNDGQARWLLARSANEYYDGKPEAAKATLDAAMSKSTDLALDKDFWKLRFQLVFDKKQDDPNSVLEFCDSSIDYLANLDPERRVIAAEFVALLFRKNDRIDLAIRTLVKSIPEIRDRKAQLNNEIAYYRALLKQDLDTALIEINTALKSEQPTYELLDTKAWVLHGLGQDEIAIKFADESVKRFYAREDIRLVFGPEKVISTSSIVEKESAAKDKPEDPDADHVAENKTAISTDKTDPQPQPLPSPLQIKKRFPNSEKEIEELLKQIAVLRFHRACILDELGRVEEAEIDYFWLDHFGYTDTQKLN